MAMLWLVAIFAFPCALDNPADTKFVFRSGGTMSGEVVSESKEDGRSYIVIRTEAGSLYKFDKTKIVQRIEKPNSKDEVYRRQLLTIENTPEGHWKMYNWCKEAGRSKFRNEMRFHLKQIVQLDASDEDAWRRLGDVGEPYIEVNGRWVPEEQHYVSRGYVRVKGRWVPQILLPEKARQETAEELAGNRKKEFKNFKKNILSKNNKQLIQKELKRITDPTTLHSIQRELDKDISPELRVVYLEAVGQVNTRHAQRILIKNAIEHSDYNVREAAMLQLEQEHFSPESTIRMASEYLTPPLPRNGLVNRAGALLGRFKNPVAIVPLIGALSTEHKEATGNDPARTNVGIGTGGTSFTNGQGPKFVVRQRQNEKVLQALYETTGEDFGFDAATWQRWYVSEHTVVDANVREDSDN